MYVKKLVGNKLNTMKTKEETTRTEMINIIRSINVPFAAHIKDQDYIILLRNMPPDSREAYAQRLYKEKLITTLQLSEFSHIKH